MEPIDRDPKALFPAFAETIQRFIAAWNLNNPLQPVQIFEAMRTRARQAELYAMGRTRPSNNRCVHQGKAREFGTCPIHPLGATVTNAPEGMSWHNYGLAVDIVFDADPVKPGLQASWEAKFPWDKLGALGMRMGLEWAGAWKTFREMPHFQDTKGLNLTEANELFRVGAMRAVWAEAKA